MFMNCIYKIRAISKLFRGYLQTMITNYPHNRAGLDPVAVARIDLHKIIL